MLQVENLEFSVSHTTRPPRSREQDGRDYYFVREDVFQEMVGNGAFIEWARVHDNCYGTALKPLQEAQAKGRDVLLDIDVQGAAILRQEKKLQGVYIFIAPPGVDELESRLRGRGTEDEDTIRTRLQNGIEELRQSNLYDYVVVNDKVADAARMISGIIYAERARQRRMGDGRPIGPGVLL
jgi:guanylate kinase